MRRGEKGLSGYWEQKEQRMENNIEHAAFSI